MPDERLLSLYTALEQIPLFASAKDLEEAIHTQGEASAFLVGDAIYFAQRDEGPKARELVVRATLDTSFVLFQIGYANRGIIHSGKFCSQGEVGKLPSLYGRGVIDAYRAEQDNKITGIALHDSLYDEAKGWKTGRSSETFLITRKIDKYRYITCTQHRQAWEKFISEHQFEHPYTAAAKCLLDGAADWEACKKTEIASQKNV